MNTTNNAANSIEVRERDEPDYLPDDRGFDLRARGRCLEARAENGRSGDADTRYERES